jgi:hypothetical protein
MDRMRGYKEREKEERKKKKKLSWASRRFKKEG